MIPANDKWDQNQLRGWGGQIGFEKCWEGGRREMKTKRWGGWASTPPFHDRDRPVIARSYFFCPARESATRATVTGTVFLKGTDQPVTRRLITAVPCTVTSIPPVAIKAASAPIRAELSDVTGILSTVLVRAGIFTVPVFPAAICWSLPPARNVTVKDSSRRVTPNRFGFCTRIATSKSSDKSETERTETSASVTTGSRRIGIVPPWIRPVHNTPAPVAVQEISPASSPGHTMQQFRRDR